MGSAPRNRGLIRQWRLLRALQAARMGLTFAELVAAAQEAVCLRTIRRDIDTLTIAGFPIEVKSGQPFACASKVYWREPRVN